MNNAHWKYSNDILTHGLELGKRVIRSPYGDIFIASDKITLLRNGAKLCSDAVNKAKLFSQQFCSVFTVVGVDEQREV